MAAAKARRGLAFFTFSDYILKDRLEQIYSLLVREKITVGESSRDMKRLTCRPFLASVC